MSETIDLAWIREHRRDMSMTGVQVIHLVPEEFDALKRTVEAAHVIHGHGPTGYARRPGNCDLCTALEQFDFPYPIGPVYQSA